jgi:hypothetical protein
VSPRVDTVLLGADVPSYLTSNADTQGDAYRPHFRVKTLDFSSLSAPVAGAGVVAQESGSRR